MDGAADGAIADARGGAEADEGMGSAAGSALADAGGDTKADEGMDDDDDEAVKGAEGMNPPHSKASYCAMNFCRFASGLLIRSESLERIRSLRGKGLEVPCTA